MGFIIISFLFSFVFAIIMNSFGPIPAFLFIIFFGISYLFIIKFEVMFLAYIVLRPTFDMLYGSGISVGSSTLNLAAVMTLLFILSSIFFIIRQKKHIYISKEVIFYLVFIIFAIFGTIYNFNIVKLDGLFTLLRLVAIFFLMLIILQEYTSVRQLEKLSRILFYSTVIPVLYAIVQMFTKINTTIYHGEGFARVNGGFPHSNPFAVYLSVFIIMLYAILILKEKISFNNKKILWSIEIILLICLLFTYGRGAWIASCASILIISICYIRGRILWPIFLIVPLFFTFYFFVGTVPFLGDISTRFKDVGVWESKNVLFDENNSLGWRIQYWKELLTKAFGSPVVGYGLGSVVFIGSAHVEAHNNYVQIFVETGLGALFYFSIFFMFLKRAIYGSWLIDNKHKFFYVGSIGVILFYLIASFSDHLIRNTVSQTYFFSFLTMIICYDKIHSDSRYQNAA